MKVLFCASEVFPFAKTGGLADVCGTLPLALENQGVDVSIILPRYQSISIEKFRLKKINKELYAVKIGRNIKVLFLENKKLFGRDGIYGYNGGDYPDNLERFQYYSRRTVDLLKELDFQFDIIHCHDWHAALIPVYLKTIYKSDAFYKRIKTVLTIHNLAYQGFFPKTDFSKLGLPMKFFGPDALEFFGRINLLKGGIIFSDRVTTVSPQYAKEIQAKQLGFGLDGVLKDKEGSLRGILNGLDYRIWDSAKDTFLAKKYSKETFERKYENKKYIQKTLKLKIQNDIPLFGFIGRMTEQKGMQLILDALDDFLKMDIQLIFLGTGEERYQAALKRTASRHPKKVAVVLKLSEAWAHRIYAGSDFFLMPSTFEPCGLSQLISLKYGAVPIAYKTGGLVDTIQNFDGQNGNGFVFSEYTKEVFVRTVKKAAELYRTKNVFNKLVKKTFDCDFSWDKSAAEYHKLYDECLRLA